MEKCSYRNCKNKIKGRKDKIYCCRSCKCMEQTYRKRENKKLENKNGNKL